MRTIKFRAQQFDHGKHGFQYGSYVTDNKNYHAIVKENKDDPETMLNTLINPETLGQFTGLKDCNGVDIYEGDVIQWGDNVNEVVVFDDDISGFCTGSSMLCKDSMKVIGNIHESPNLIEDKQHE